MGSSFKAIALGMAMAAATVFAMPTAAEAATITFTANDVADETMGEDLWRYEYAVSDFTFSENVSLSLFFDSLIFADVRPVSVPSGDWDPLLLLPAYPGDSFVYDALALFFDASIASPFVIDVVRAPGAVLPSIQLFAINAFDADGNFLDVLESGQATSQSVPSVVPEPSTLTLIGIGLIARRRRRAIATRAP